TTRRSTAPYSDYRNMAARTGSVNLSSGLRIFPSVKLPFAIKTILLKNRKPDKDRHFSLRLIRLLFRVNSAPPRIALLIIATCIIVSTPALILCKHTGTAVL
ncbi:hypothetical protein, partial [Stecheria intestinalis]|uniref:hypothetical protein n=1 Tax=Stecheria intestinalis TaxID=2606630 RepID=UPI0023F463BE